MMLILIICVIKISTIVLKEPYLIRKELIDSVNENPNSKWTAGVNPKFAGKKFSEIQSLMGARLTSAPHLPTSSRYRRKISQELPDFFDTYDKNPCCRTPVRDQGKCGSCWAFSSTSALSDRICVATGKTVILSPQDPVSCESDQYACNGGYLSQVWLYFENSGVVTESCFPYQSSEKFVPRCPNHCSTGEVWDEVKKKVVKGSTIHFETVEDAMIDLVNHGSIQTGFTVYEDFFSYRTGVYHHVSGGVAGGHAVKIQGYGIEDGVEYWNVENSWSDTFGMSGYFWITRGDNECGFEEQMYAGIPDV